MFLSCREFSKRSPRGRKGVYLNGHGGEDQQVGEVEAERGDEEAKLVALDGGGGLPRVEVGEGSDGDGGAGGDEREVGREHLPLQVPELVPRQIPWEDSVKPNRSAQEISFVFQKIGGS